MADAPEPVVGEVSTGGKKFLGKMIDRLYASLSTGPAINCRPHASRQRVDLRSLARLDGSEPEGLLAALLGDDGEIKVYAKKTPKADAAAMVTGDERHERDERDELVEHQALFHKLRVIADDARNFQNDTGAHALFVGYPLLQIPPAKSGARGFASQKRILAPIAFVPVTLTVKTGRAQAIELACAATGAERVVPNQALLAWVENETGADLGELFADDDGSQPWKEIADITAAVCKALRIAPPAGELGPTTALAAVPRSDDEDGKEARVLASAVLGLFPLSNQSILRDLEAMAATAERGEDLEGPVASFVRVGVSLAPAAAAPAETARSFDGERLVSHADPCQARAVRLARASRGLVVHGPPGTGKSQTIANVIGDHLGRGERVLFVCDKRTALDVVQYRLDHLGLGKLCAIVHDAQRDQRDLYVGIREQLDGLPESKPNEGAVAELAGVDKELAQLHRDLTAYEEALSARPEGGAAPSFHELVGRWLEIPGEDVAELAEPRLVDLGPTETTVREVLDRAAGCAFAGNPWRGGTLGIDLTAFLARSAADVKAAVADLATAARAADELADPALPAFSPGADVVAQGESRAAVAGVATKLLAGVDPEALARWAPADATAIAGAARDLAALQPHRDTIVRAKPGAGLDPELAIAVRGNEPPIGHVVLWLGQLAAYLQIARRWYAWFCFGRKKVAAEVVQRFGLALGAASAERVSAFLDVTRARTLLADFHARTLAAPPTAAALVDKLRAPTGLATLPAVGGSTALAAPLPDAALPQALADHADIFSALTALDGADLSSERREIAAKPDLLPALCGAAARAKAIAAVEASLAKAGLFAAPFRARIADELRRGGKVALHLEGLAAAAGTIEGVLRIEHALAPLPAPLAAALTALAERGVEPDAGVAAIEKAVLAGEIGRRLRAEPRLQTTDGDKLRAHHTRYRALETRKRALVRDAILHQWTTRQRKRLLASTGTRLNTAGAELRRRLMLRGEKAMRVRQVIAAGADTEGGDPLFDVRPVWMASPETVAQIFPRLPIFDVVIFDEASQCRLEEALPVMTRAKRVVIAGDPKQLPPTRFFESTIAGSAESEAETDQELFEEQQSEVEDLLGAALNLEIEQCYLDVHYRSRNSDLIEFSNKSFYDARLQAIPGHPKHRAVAAPLRLHHVAGVYDKRVNAIEAKAVVDIVKQLLARAQVPSIGIACFNLSQREAILHALDEAAAADTEFAARLATARTRRGAASFEGLFVKNLENVQGDERDHMIISTTYGRDPTGRFYRRFGPLAQAGGGRRLNVLITRARDEVHLVTSIPHEVYRGLAPVEAGRVPNGAWLLFSYLAYAEDLAKAYADDAARLAAAEVAHEVHVRPSATGSRLAVALAKQLATDGHASTVHRGNDGFQIDIALHHPTRAEDVTVGVLCDGTRFDKAADKVEWDLFRTGILEGQGWQLVRLWSPHLFRDPAAARLAIGARVADFLAKEGKPVTLPPVVEPSLPPPRKPDAMLN